MWQKIVDFWENLKDFDRASLKLTGYYVGIIMLISFGFSLTLYNIYAQEIDRGLGRQSIVFRDLPKGFMPDQISALEQLREQQIEESNQKIKNDLVYFNLLILIVSSLASYFLARRTLRPIEESVEAQNRFTADASHELRTPLTAMKTEIEVALRDQKLSPTQARDLLSSNLEEIGKLESLSNALLTLARNNGKNQMVFTEIPLSEVIVEAYQKVEHLAQQKSINIVCHPELDSGSIPFRIPGDKQSLVELFIILLDNAIKYSPAKSEVSIAIGEDDRSAVISIKDQGIGIKASDLPYIFNRFYRADSSRSREKTAGYGLGLSIAKQIVDLHHGDISVISKPGKGSEFVVKLPK